MPLVPARNKLLFAAMRLREHLGSAACTGQWDLFWAPEGQFAESVTEREVREAKAVSLCRSCPVRAQCGERARGERWGVWAGQTEADREARKREQRNAKRRVGRGREVAA